MSARSGLVGKKSSWPYNWPYLGSSEAIFSMDRKNPKNAKMLPIFLGGPMGTIHPVWALAAIHPVWDVAAFADCRSCGSAEMHSPRKWTLQPLQTAGLFKLVQSLQ